ncbi:MAG: glycosyltransferase family 4 protein [Porticoccaceae bacterium]|nr:glycosyltransferase family 4 protein [Porticoccaceae bacterium]
MKVVQILPNLNGGGVERGTLEVARHLVEQGCESVVISAGGAMVSQLEAEGSRHVCWDLGKKSPLTLRHVQPLRRWLQREKPDIVHLRSRLPAWVAWLAWRKLPEAQRPGLVTTVHGLYSVSPYSAIMTRGERVIAVSETVRNYIAANYPQTDMNLVRLVYRGIDPQDFPFGYKPDDQWLHQWRQQFPQLAGKKIITLPGRLTRLKGHHNFIDLITALKQAHMPIHGLIVGGEDPKRRQYASELRGRIEAEGLANDISFTGDRKDIRDIYAVSDVVLSLSTKPESFGRTTLEALAMGVPVVGYDHGGVGEILAALYPQGKTPIGDQDALVHCVTTVLNSQIKPAGNNRFFKADMVAKTLTIYRELRP